MPEGDAKGGLPLINNCCNSNAAKPGTSLPNQRVKGRIFVAPAPFCVGLQLGLRSSLTRFMRKLGEQAFEKIWKVAEDRSCGA
jgi:hypothetical protein